MPNYRETSLTGTSWVRCRAVTITNPLTGTGELNLHTQSIEGPTAYFQEEKVVVMDGGQMRQDVGACQQAFLPDGEIALRNPDTGELTGTTATHAQLYAILFSLYMQTALARDVG